MVCFIYQNQEEIKIFTVINFSFLLSFSQQTNRTYVSELQKSINAYLLCFDPSRSKLSSTHQSIAIQKQRKFKISIRKSYKRLKLQLEAKTITTKTTLMIRSKTNLEHAMIKLFLYINESRSNPSASRHVIKVLGSYQIQLLAHSIDACPFLCCYY